MQVQYSHDWTLTYIYIYIYVCVCVCVSLTSSYIRNGNNFRRFAKLRKATTSFFKSVCRPPAWNSSGFIEILLWIFRKFVARNQV